jgi:hypothetical protein
VSSESQAKVQRATLIDFAALCERLGKTGSRLERGTRADGKPPHRTEKWMTFDKDLC